MRVDTHVHFVYYSDPARQWWVPQAPALRRDCRPDDYFELADAAGISAVIVMQTNEVEAETDFLLDLSADCSRIAGVVGWVDTRAADASARLQRLCAHPSGKLVGLRPMIFRRDDPMWITEPGHDTFFDEVTRLGLSVDLLCFPQHLKGAERRVEMHPEINFVLNHGGFPRLRERDALDRWKADVAALASRGNVFCKFSGFAEFARAEWVPADLQEVADHLLACFGADRLLWAGNWPVCETSGGWERWVAGSDILLSRLGNGERRKVWETNAGRAYRKLALPERKSGFQ